MKNDINPQYKKFYLKNGIKCILYERQEIHSTTIRANVKVGSLDEDDSTNGLSHFIEHVVHEGTEEFPTWDKMEEFKTFYSISANAYTSADHTQYYATVPSHYTEQSIKYLSQIIFHPLFKETDVDRERVIILDELTTYQDEVDFHELQIIKDFRFTDNSTPYSYEIIGTRERLESYSRKDLIDFWKKYYFPKNMEIYILGNTTEEECRKYLEQYFDLGQENNKEPERLYKTTIPDFSDFSINARQKRDLDKYYLTLTFPSFDFKSYSIEKRNIVSFVKTILANPSFAQSVLWKSLRQELGIVYSVYSWGYDLYGRNIFGISTSFQKDYLKTVIEEIQKGVNSIKNRSVGDEVFKAKKRKVLDTQLMQLDSPDRAIEWILSLEEELDEHNKGMRLSEYLDFVNELSFKEVLDVAEEIFDWSKVNIGIVSQEESEAIASKVKDIWNLNKK